MMSMPIIEYIRTLSEQGFWGAITLKYEGGCVIQHFKLMPCLFDVSQYVSDLQKTSFSGLRPSRPSAQPVGVA
jgi:hypothetical protein